MADRVWDISVPVSAQTPEWPGDVPFSCGWTCRLERGDAINLSSVTGSPHIGTHADAPLHVMPDAPGSEALDLAAYLGPCVVIDVSRERDGALSLQHNDPRLRGAIRVLLKTGRTIADGRFPDAWPVLEPGQAAAMVGNGVRLIGTDAPSVDERESKTLVVHKSIFGLGGFVLENLDLRRVEPGGYDLVAAPVRWEGVDAAPVRAVLRRT